MRKQSAKVFTVVSIAILTANLTRADGQEFPGSTWSFATPESVGLDSTKLFPAVAGLNGNVFVTKDGFAVAQKGDVAKKFPLYSVAKSITALVFGAALRQGKVAMDDTVAGSAYPSGPLSTYRQFLSMRSDFGLQPHAPGGNFAYNNMAVHHYGESLRSLFGNKSPTQILDEQIYAITGREDPIWFYGLWSGWGGGFESSARDAARIGLLVARGGKWDGQEVVPESFVADLFQCQVDPSLTQSTSIGTGDTQGPPGDNWWNQFHISDLLAGNYSFGWWVNDGDLYPQLPSNVIWADGLNGHRIIIAPDHDLVVTVTYGGDWQTPAMILKPILDSLQAPVPPGSLSGELKTWHKVTISFIGPDTSESATPNPFVDYRLDVTFKNGPRTFTVPGYYAANGSAANSNSSDGNVWRVHFMPDEAGEWTYDARFVTGSLVAMSTSSTAGTPTSFHGSTGKFTVAPTDKSGTDLRGKGRLEYVGERYLRFAETGEPFLKAGANSPENFLAYAGFDQTTPSHLYAPHAADWQAGDVDWKDGEGKNIVGALNYLASKGMNSVYFLTMNVAGDGDDVWPWNGYASRFRFDCSKLDQWELVFEHMDRLGIQMHVVMQESENDHLLDGGLLGNQRKVYYRELVARFAHHPALTWNLGEENTNATEMQKLFADHVRALDPYDHPIVIHALSSTKNDVYVPLLGHATIDGPSLHLSDFVAAHAETRKWIDLSSAAGHPWAVTVDEIGPANSGVLPDVLDPLHDASRRYVLWANLIAGGAGVEWYFGHAFENDDLDCEDWRSRDAMWTQTEIAMSFFHDFLPFAQMEAADGLLGGAGTGNYVLAKAGDTYAVYLSNGGSPALDLSAAPGPFAVRWYDPRNGGPLRVGSVGGVLGGASVSLGDAPNLPNQDWVVLLSKHDDFTVHYGAGVPGYLGQTPLVDANDPKVGNLGFAVTLEQARPASSAFLFAGRKPLNAPFKAGTLLVDFKTVGWFVFTTDGLGQSKYGLPLPPNAAYVGKSLYFQWMAPETSAPLGVSMSNGLQVLIHD